MPTTSVPVVDNVVVTGSRVQLQRPERRTQVIVQNLDLVNSIWIGGTNVTDGTPWLPTTGTEIPATEQTPFDVGDDVDLWLVSAGATINAQALHLR
jgi:hypothetical protein